MNKPPLLFPPILLALLTCLLTGCMGTSEIKEGPVYPPSVKRGTTLDIQVVRSGTRIELTNTTARTFGKSKLWVNGRFARDIDGLAVGQTLNLSLKDFTNEFGYPYRAGGFFATQKSDRLVLAEIQPLDATPPEMIGLIVVGGGEE